MSAASPGAWIRDGVRGTWMRFGPSRGTIVAMTPSEVQPALRAIEQEVENRRAWAVGWITYEAAPGFDSALIVRSNTSLPLVHFSLHDAPDVIAALPARPDGMPFIAPPAWIPSISRQEYEPAIAAIRDRIARGDTYQVNFTWRLRSRFEGDAFEWFRTLVRAQAARHGAFIDARHNGDGYLVLSASPELFFRLEDGRIVTRPMKGTAPRAPSAADDDAAARELQASAKNRAENIMIVDMMRNDLGRIARIGSVRVPALFELERYPTVWQLTSTVEAETDAGVGDVLAALFPSASVTGAPKASTMAIIASLETSPRGIYTGAVGWIAPGRRAEFNVAIRTAVVAAATGAVEYGTGGGVVWDSTAEGEYEEGLAKARFLSVSWPEFALLETMRVEEGGEIALLEEHLERLLGSARYFGYRVDEAAIRAELATAVTATVTAARATETSDAPEATHAPLQHRLRLVVAEDGTISIEMNPLEDSPGTGARPVRIALAADPISTRDPFIHHKTTHREVYRRALATRPGVDDVILWNERGEVTETTIANLVFDLDGARVTPPASSGLLEGTFRRRLLAEGTIGERVVRIEDLGRAGAIWLVNSVRGFRRAELHRA